MITVLDIGFGNVASVENMLKKLNIPVQISDSTDSLLSADGIILPGVGSFDNCIRLMRSKKDLFDMLESKVLTERVPFLGICIGMQLLFNQSEEGVEKGFGWISGEVIKFKLADDRLKVPHMGWSEILIKDESSPLFSEGLNRYYFVHSYHASNVDESHVVATSLYGDIEFPCFVRKDNIYGAQFHPEKSHKFGLSLLRNFSKIVYG